MANSSEGVQEDLVQLTSILHGWIALNTLKTKLSEGEKKVGEENPTEAALEAAVQEKLDELNSFLEELITKGVLKPGSASASTTDVPDLGSGGEEEEEGGGEGEEDEEINKGEKGEATSSSAPNSTPTGNKPVAPTDTTQAGGKKRTTRRRFLH